MEIVWEVFFGFFLGMERKETRDWGRRFGGGLDLSVIFLYFYLLSFLCVTVGFASNIYQMQGVRRDLA